ncbi:MAG TPA: hypothetical protein VFQ43_07235 [Nitrososphaera sp.]|nr:hypothetical protein [Nitrososphaera sp.]
MRLPFLTFLVLLGYAAFLFLAFLFAARIFTKRFSRFWQPCFYLCSLALVALMAVLPLTNRRGRMNDDFANNAIMFLPLATACLVLPFVAFKKPQRYFALGAVSLSIVAFFFYARSLTLWLSYGDCATLPTRFFHQLVRGDKDSFVKDTRFKVWVMGTALTPEGHMTGFTKLRASDCVEVTIEDESMSSPSEAENEMGKKIRRASRVVERGLKVDLTEHPDGERAVLLFDTDTRAEIVLWFKGTRSLHIIESTSLAHALACEKLIQRGYRMDPQGYVLASGQ